MTIINCNISIVKEKELENLIIINETSDKNFDLAALFYFQLWKQSPGRAVEQQVFFFLEYDRSKYILRFHGWIFICSPFGHVLYDLKVLSNKMSDLNNRTSLIISRGRADLVNECIQSKTKDIEYMEKSHI